MDDILLLNLNGESIKHYYQWDSEQCVVFNGKNMTNTTDVHFCNIDSDKALVVKPDIDGDRIIAKVPNKLLQVAKPIVVYLYRSDEANGNNTMWSARITVVPRPKPADYVYTETEILSYTHLDNRIKALEDEAPPQVYLVTLNSSNKAEQPFAEIVAAYRAGYDVKCSYNGYLLSLKLEPGTECVFSGTVDTTVFNVVVYSNGSTAVFDRSLAQKDDIPSKTSQLENDSGYLIKAPVTSVNSKTGDVAVPTPLKVIIEQLSDGSYQPDPTFDELEEFHDQGYLLYCQYGNLELPLTSAVPHFYTFSCVEGGNVHTVRIGPSSVKVSTVPMGGGTDPTTAVLYTPQNLTPDQKTQARENIGACGNLRPRVELSDSVVTLEPNQLYVFPEMASLSITFGGEADSGAVQEYQFRFISGAVATTLILPEAVKGDITVDANSVVEVSVVDNYAISQSWAVG